VDGVAGDGHHRAVLEVLHDCLTETLDYMVSSGKLVPGSPSKSLCSLTRFGNNEGFNLSLATVGEIADHCWSLLVFDPSLLVPVDD
jgi:hypothetical protein